jgi:hypothetical protein
MTSSDRVSDYLKELEESRRHKKIFQRMVFPDTKIRERNAIVNLTYICHQNVCDFSPALIGIENDLRLLKWRSKDICVDIVRDIESHQDDYLPHVVDGYSVNRMGHELVHLKREDSNDSSVTGVIEYNDLRKDSMDFYDEKKLEFVGIMLKQTNWARSSCTIL